MTAPPAQIPLGRVLRYPRPRQSDTAEVDGHPNFFFATRASLGGAAVQLEAGISAPKQVADPDGALREPAILISSSPHKTGSSETPWQDIFDVDNGYIRYFGDNKAPGTDPSRSPGNKRLLRAAEQHSATIASKRRDAVPLVFFRRVSRQGQQKGFVQFEGFGVITRVERVSQVAANGESFVNYAFDCAVLDLLETNDVFDWAWINSRRDPAKTLDQTHRWAPASWRGWVEAGNSGLTTLRRNVVRRALIPTTKQRPAPSSRGGAIISQVYDTYEGRKVDFEAVAAWAAERILSASGLYRRFGITKATGDRGFDFLGRLTVGQDVDGFGATNLVVLGQAKCESPNTPTNALHLARTVARLRRGWLGVFVTTSHFSTSGQEEVLQDRYPLVMVNGSRLAIELEQELHDRGRPSLAALLDWIDSEYKVLTDISDPDQVLFR